MKSLCKEIVPAPVASDPRLPFTIFDVECGSDEEVEWHWTMTDRSRFVSGYSIVRRLPKSGASDRGRPRLSWSKNKIPRAHAKQRRYRGLRNL